MIGKCSGCGAKVFWIKTVRGKNMPCDPKLVPYWEKEKAVGKIVTADGRVLSCTYEGAGVPSGYGFIPHWGTCPASRNFRKRGHV